MYYSETKVIMGGLAHVPILIFIVNFVKGKFEFLSSAVAMCVFTLGAKFSYKGTHNDDLPTVTSIFKKIDGIWKIHWMQRSSGDSDLSLWD